MNKIISNNSDSQTEISEKKTSCPPAEAPLILAVETSGRTGSVAIAAGDYPLGQISLPAPMKHSSLLLTSATKLLEKFDKKSKDIDHIYISVGPGSYTGLRIAVTTAKILHLANAVKIVAIDTLDVIAANTTQDTEQLPERIAAILDAKRGQFFIAVYQRTSEETYPAGYEKILPDSLLTAEQFKHRFANADNPISLLGEGLVFYKDSFTTEGVHFLDERYWWPKAKNVHLLGWQKALQGQFEDPLTLQPKYLRQPDAKVKTCK